MTAPHPATKPSGPEPVRTRLLALVWSAGLLSALGIGTVRGTASSLVPGGGAITGVVVLIALGVGVGCQIAAISLMRLLVMRIEPMAERPTAAAAWTLFLGGAGMIALNTVLVSGPTFFPPFGALSLLLLCSPYPVAFLLLRVRSRAAVIASVVAGLALAVSVVPLHKAQEHLAVQVWLHEHPGLDRDVLRAVTWPTGEVSPYETGPFGVRATVFFQDSNIDGAADAVVTVSPASADPCGPVAVVADDETVPEPDPERYEEITTSPPTLCTPTGPNSWTLSGTGFTGYAELRDNALITLSADSFRASDDLAAVARTLRPLDDHALWSSLSSPFGVWWLLY